MLEVDPLIYGHCPALAEGVPPLSAWQLRQPGPRILCVEPARPNMRALLWPPRPATSSFHRVRLILALPAPRPLERISPSERPRSNATSPSSSPCQKQAGWYPSSVSCVGEAEKKKRTRLGTNFFSLEPWRPVILHLAPWLCSRRPRIYGLSCLWLPVVDSKISHALLA